MVNKQEHFANAGQFMDWFRERRAENGVIRSFGYHDSHRSNDGVDILTNGDETHVQRANELVDQIVTNVDTPKNEWRRDVYGYYPDVEAFIRGEPENMWMMHRVQDEQTPIRVFVGLTSSAMIDEEDLIKRGCALAAFAIAMSSIRPVVITPFVTLGSSRYTGRGTRNMLISWDISTQPLILSELMSLTRPEVTRYVGIEACRQMFGKIAEDDPSFHSDSFNEQRMREHLNAKPNDLYLPVIHASDPILKDPIKWVNDMVERYTSGDVTDIETPEDY